MVFVCIPKYPRGCHQVGVGSEQKVRGGWASGFPVRPPAPSLGPSRAAPLWSVLFIYFLCKTSHLEKWSDCLGEKQRLLTLISTLSFNRLKKWCQTSLRCVSQDLFSCRVICLEPVSFCSEYWTVLSTRLLLYSSLIPAYNSFPPGFTQPLGSQTLGTHIYPFHSPTTDRLLSLELGLRYFCWMWFLPISARDLSNWEMAV